MRARQQVVYPLFKKQFTVTLAGFVGVRGIHSFPPVDVETSDAFGLLERSRQLSSEKSLTIYPTYFPNVLEKSVKLLQKTNAMPLIGRLRKTAICTVCANFLQATGFPLSTGNPLLKVTN